MGLLVNDKLYFNLVSSVVHPNAIFDFLSKASKGLSALPKYLIMRDYKSLPENPENKCNHLQTLLASWMARTIGCFAIFSNVIESTRTRTRSYHRQAVIGHPAGIFEIHVRHLGKSENIQFYDDVWLGVLMALECCGSTEHLLGLIPYFCQSRSPFFSLALVAWCAS